MITFSIIQKSQLEGAMRIDAEYYQPEYLELDKKIKKFNNYLLGDIISKFSSGKNLMQVEFSNDHPKFIRTQNVRPIIINKGGLSSLDPREKNYPRLSEGDLLFVRVGEGVGNSSVVTPEFEGDSFSDNVIRSKVKRLNPYFISIFLNSRLGYLYWERVSKGTARSLVSSENISAIRIPFLGKDIEEYSKKIILDASDLLKNSEQIYKEAEKLLLEKVGAKNFNVEENLPAIINFSDILEARRMDAEYFQPKYAKLISRIESQNHKCLSDLVSMKKGIEIGAEQYRDEGKLFIRVSSMGKFEINGSDQKYLSEKLYEELKSNFQPQIGEILLTKDATPGIAYVLKEKIEGIISGGTLRLKLKEKIESEYFALCLNSIIGQMQAQRDAGGSVIAHWKPEQIKNVVIPILPEPTQQKIADLVRQSHEARKKAKELLEEAKRKVEEMIEKNN